MVPLSSRVKKYRAIYERLPFLLKIPGESRISG